jgi:hypothetical protein
MDTLVRSSLGWWCRSGQVRRDDLVEPAWCVGLRMWKMTRMPLSCLARVDVSSSCRSGFSWLASGI